MPKIADVEAIPLSIPYIDDPPTLFQESWGVQVYVKVKLGDVAGWGEVLVYGGDLVDAYLGVLNSIVKPAVVGEEVNEVGDVAKIVNKLERLLFTAGLCGIVSGAIGGLEMALWDALGKYLGKNIVSLIGQASRTKIPVYASFPRYSNEEQVVKAVSKALDRGFTMVKIHQHADNVAESIKAIRRVYGYGIRVAVDLNAAYPNVEGAAKLIESISRYEVYWVEEPIWPPNNYEGLRQLAERAPIPIAAGENEYSTAGFINLAKSGVRYLQPDISKLGGLLKLLTTIDSLKTLNRPIAPHLRPHKSILAHLYTLAAASVRGDVVVVEWPLTWVNDIYDANVEVSGGEVDISPFLKRPGLGLNVIEGNFSKYGYFKKFRPLIFH